MTAFLKLDITREIGPKDCVVYSTCDVLAAPYGLDDHIQGSANQFESWVSVLEHHLKALS